MLRAIGGHFRGSFDVHGTVIVFGLFLACVPASGCQRRQSVSLLEQKCGTCHSADLVYRSRYDVEGWKRVLHGMKMRGLKLDPQEEQDIMAILIRDFAEAKE